MNITCRDLEISFAEFFARVERRYDPFSDGGIRVGDASVTRA